MAVKSLAQSSILQPSNTNSMLGDYESNYFHHLETVRLSSSSLSITFTNLAQYSDFQHLQIRAAVKTTNSNTNYTLIRFNSDTASNYTGHYIRGEGSTPYSGQNTPASFIQGPDIPGTSVSGSFTGLVIDILDPFETTKFTTLRSLSGFAGGTNQVALMSGSWRNTAALTSITIENDSRGLLGPSSRFSLYGFKARS